MLTLVGRCGIFLTTSRTMLLIHLYGTLPLGTSMGIPVLMTGIRRYTHEKNRTFAFGIFYTAMGIAILVSGPTVDVLTIWYTGGNSDISKEQQAAASAPIHGSWSLSSYRAIILVGILTNVVACCISFTVREVKVG